MKVRVGFPISPRDEIRTIDIVLYCIWNLFYNIIIYRRANGCIYLGFIKFIIISIPNESTLDKY